MVSKIHHNDHHYLKKDRGLYDIPVDEAAAEWESKRQDISNLSTLSLFNRQRKSSHEQAEESSKGGDERPITPIDDSVRVPPKTYEALSKVIYRRICPRAEWDHISVEDQSSLGGVIMGEVNAVWPVLRRQVDDPFLTQRQNKELQRRISVHIVSVCEQLFIHYCAKIKILNARKVFSNPANLSRIRAQLSLDAGKYLNILDVRRHIILDLKKPLTNELVTFNREDLGRSPASPSPPKTQALLSFHRLVESSRPKRRLKYKFNLYAELQSMKSQMPTLNMAKVQPLLPLREHAIFSYEDPNLQLILENQDKDSVPYENQSSRSESPVQCSQPKTRCPSEPLPKHQLLLDELIQRIEDDLESTRTQSRVQSDSQQSEVHHSKLKSKTPSRPTTSMGVVQPPSEDPKGFDPRDPQEDLKRLIAKQERVALKEKEGRLTKSDAVEDDIPPLIQAITRREVQNERVRQLNIQEDELDEKKRKEDEERRVPLPESLYAQPVVVQTKLPARANPVDHTRLTIRMSDVKINERVDLSSVTLDLFLPIYNDLTGEISQATVKELDSNLFQGGELREVYSEIMKTVPNIHQRYDDDPVIVIPPTNVNLTKILASSTLTRPRSQQVINPKLRKDANHTLSDTQLQEMLMEKISQIQHHRRHSMYPASDDLSRPEAAAAFNAFTPNRLNASGIEKGTRAYASWLGWWKSTINTDDYFKYMSTQDTDFLSVLFHFYDSEAGDSDSETSMRTAKLEAQREREHKLAKLKKEKEEYTPGLWNSKSVMLGGLGKDPEIEEEKEDEVSQFETPDALRKSQSRSPTSMNSPFENERISGKSFISRSGFSPGRTSISSKTAYSATPRKEDITPRLSLQERLEIVWRRLKMSEEQKLDFALKYSSDDYIKKLPNIVSAWERVTDLILAREENMRKLEIFEKEASDPNRFFERGYKGSSVARLREAKVRAGLYKKLEKMETMLKPRLLSVTKQFSDVVSYNGRPYLEKMSWDRMEMLYWLQQERRAEMLRDQGQPEHLELFLHQNITVPPSTSSWQTPRRYNPLPLNSVQIHIPE